MTKDINTNINTDLNKHNIINNYLDNNISLDFSKNNKTKIINITSGSLPLIINYIYKKLNSSILIINTDPQMTDKLSRELSFYNSDINFLPFPDWETLPYDKFSPHGDIISNRIETLYKLSNNISNNKYITSISLTTALQKLCPNDYINQNSFVLKTGDKLNIKLFKEKLIEYGYKNIAEVSNHGEFNIKGSIIDIYTMGSILPYRIDLFDDEVDSIRIFDPESQRSIDKISEINLLPAHEFPLTDESLKNFRNNWRNLFNSNLASSDIYNSLEKLIIPPGIEYYIPLFYNNMDSIFDYISDDTVIILINSNLNSELNSNNTNITKFLENTKERYNNHNYDSKNPLVPPEELYLNNTEFFNNLNKFRNIDLNLELDLSLNINSDTKKSWHQDSKIKAINSEQIAINRNQKDPINNLKNFIHQNNNSNTKILILAESSGRKDVILELFNKNNLSIIKDLDLETNNINKFDWFITQNNNTNNIYITTANLDNGFIINSDLFNIILISESELYGNQVQQRRLRHKTSTKNKYNITTDNIIKNLAELSPNQYVIHEDHGIGKYLGLDIIELNNIKSEYIKLLYADNSNLYVPITSLDKISKYNTSLDQENIALHKLGNKNWSRAKQKALEKIRDTAAELLGIYAKRAANPGFQYIIDYIEYNKFCSEFKFEETPDQALAINQVLTDMHSKNTMDRLVCGDVGFGKTEVALRAAFIAATNNKQTAILVPTTLLAQQHYENFKDRFANFAVNIELLSRFKTAKQQAEIIDKIKAGTVDIVVGTHKLLNSSIKFKDLGLLIIDEEHRFGVTQKEKIKKLRANVDILTLTATPIPRTLNLSLTGIRDLSIITTPPQKRLSIKTFIYKREQNLIKEAINRELSRGGQVYYLHNDIKTINNIYTEIQQLFPDAKIAIGHGQMRERDLEKIMSDFYHKKYHILLCTTIIETGIDIPSANTILMDRADKLGLAQMHQLRGRVGRSHHQAYAYLFTPKEGKISKDAEKRLEAIASLEDLGAGFSLSSHDMEIRGTGNILGDEQSGHIESIGYNLYIDLLNKSIEAIKEGKILDTNNLENSGCEIDIKESSLLPDDYVHDVNQRLILYKRISTVKNDQELFNLKSEIIDRFGKLPKATENLFLITEIKLQAVNLGISKIDLGSKSGKIKFNNNPNINFNNIIKMIQSDNKTYKLSNKENNNILNFNINMENTTEKYNTISNILEKLVNAK